MSRATSIPLLPRTALLILLAGSLVTLGGCAHRPPTNDIAPPIHVTRTTDAGPTDAAPSPAGPVGPSASASAADATAAQAGAPDAGAGNTDASSQAAAPSTGPGSSTDAASSDAVNGPAGDSGPPADSVVRAKPADLFDRMRTGFMLQDVDQPAIDSQVNWFANHPDFLDRTWSRASLWLYYIVGQLEQRNMPRELALLPVIESAFEPYAYSRASAAGLWQFISDTGRRFGLKQDWWYEGRRDPIEATRAALDYLQALHDEFNGDWLLAVAAYNCGELTVTRAVERNQRRGLPTDFWHLKLPAETRGYVPELLAMRRIVATPARYGLEGLHLPNEPYFVPIDTGGQIDLKVVAEIAHISVDDIYELNPAFHRWATDPTGPFRLLVPADAAEGLQQTLAQLTADERMDVDHYTVHRHDTVASIARRYGTTPDVIRELNDLTATDRPVIDTSLRVPAKDIRLPEKVERAALIADSPARFRRGHRRPRLHIVRRGDTLYSLAQRLGTDVNTLAELNGMTPDQRLHAGQRLRVGTRYSSVAASGSQRVAANPHHGRHATLASSGGSAGGSASAGTGSSGRRLSYTVRRGDTLYGIARLLQVKVEDLLAWNDLASRAHNLKPGQVLVAFVKSGELMPGGAGLLAGKRALIVGVATERSIAWGIAQAMHAQGAQLALSYANDKFRERVEPLAAQLGAGILTLPLDVQDDAQIDAAFALLRQQWGSLDVLVHAVAFAPREALAGSYTAVTTRAAFREAHEVSSYSFTALARGALPLMAGRAGAMLTLSYLGAVRSMPSYNVMGLAKASLESSVRFLAADLGPQGVRVNAISAGPIKTLAAAGVGGFRRMLGTVAQVAPLRRNVTIQDVGNAAVFLTSDMAAGVTGEVLYVDNGFSTVGMSFPEPSGD